LGIGNKRTSFHLLGRICKSIILLKIVIKIDKTSLCKCVISLYVIPVEPGALFLLNFGKIKSKSLTVISSIKSFHRFGVFHHYMGYIYIFDICYIDE
jgi:hypothetical protein